MHPVNWSRLAFAQHAGMPDYRGRRNQLNLQWQLWAAFSNVLAAGGSLSGN